MLSVWTESGFKFEMFAYLVFLPYHGVSLGLIQIFLEFLADQFFLLHFCVVERLFDLQLAFEAFEPLGQLFFPLLQVCQSVVSLQVVDDLLLDLVFLFDFEGLFNFVEFVDCFCSFLLGLCLLNILGWLSG